MASLLTLTFSAPTQQLGKGEVLVTQGDHGGDLYVLESGRLIVERDGVDIAAIEAPDSLIGEMAVLLGKPHTATVRADRDSRVRIIADARHLLERQPGVALQVATLLCARLDATSALVAELGKPGSEKPVGQGLFGRLRSALAGGPSR
jgi:CRP/FNR family transcriptional regulator, cyclic AMP receptor protein